MDHNNNCGFYVKTLALVAFADDKFAADTFRGQLPEKLNIKEIPFKPNVAESLDAMEARDHLPSCRQCQELFFERVREWGETIIIIARTRAGLTGG